VLGAGIAFAVTRDGGTKASAQGASAHSPSTSATRPATGPTGRTGSSGSPGSTGAHGPSTSLDPSAPGAAVPTTITGAASGSKVNARTPTTWRSLTPPPTGPRGTTPPSITEAYTQGYTARCHEIWSHAGPDGQLWDAVNPDYGPFTVNDCLSGLDATFAYLANSVADARQMGVDDANSNTGDLTDSNRLRNAAGYIYDLPRT